MQICLVILAAATAVSTAIQMIEFAVKCKDQAAKKKRAKRIAAEAAEPVSEDRVRAEVQRERFLSYNGAEQEPEDEAIYRKREEITAKRREDRLGK